MSDPEDIFTWRDYEDHIYDRLSAWAGGEATVEFDPKVVGRHGKVERQVDVVVSDRSAARNLRSVDPL
ncbi:MAG: hypothetical protein ACR2OB_08490 [Solirubrobacteraceae bacterium]